VARDPLNRAFAPTVPDDTRDPPRFAQLTETVKDVFVLELRKFFANALHTLERRVELPTIEKYSTFGDGNDPFATSVSIIRKLPDTLENLPHIAVMTSGGTERRLSIGPPYVTTVQDPSYVTAAQEEPYALVDGDTLIISTMLTSVTSFTDTITFTANRFPTAAPIGAALADDVARVINEQAAHCYARVVEVSGDRFVVIEAGGPRSFTVGNTPIAIEVVGGTCAETLGIGRGGTLTNITIPSAGVANLTAPAGTWSALDVGAYITLSQAYWSSFNNGRFLITGFSSDTITDTLTISAKYGREEIGSPTLWFIGLRDHHQNATHPPKHRYAVAFDLSTQIDVITEDENTRGELIDLVLGFFSFFLEQKYFTFLGRSVFASETLTDTERANEYYQITINPPIRNSSENEIPRPSDASGRIFVNTFSVDVTISMYIDREVYWPGTTTPRVIDFTSLKEDETLPGGN
jgi:hypothetical protein